MGRAALGEAGGSRSCHTGAASPVLHCALKPCSRAGRSRGWARGEEPGFGVWVQHGPSSAALGCCHLLLPQEEGRDGCSSLPAKMGLSWPPFPPHKHCSRFECEEGFSVRVKKISRSPLALRFPPTAPLGCAQVAAAAWLCGCSVPRAHVTAAVRHERGPPKPPCAQKGPHAAPQPPARQTATSRSPVTPSSQVPLLPP